MASPISKVLVVAEAGIPICRFPEMYFPVPAPVTTAEFPIEMEYAPVDIFPLTKVRVVFTLTLPDSESPAAFEMVNELKVFVPDPPII